MTNTVYSEQRNEMNGSNYSQMSSMSKGAEERRKELEALRSQNLQMVKPILIPIYSVL